MPCGVRVKVFWRERENRETSADRLGSVRLKSCIFNKTTFPPPFFKAVSALCCWQIRLCSIPLLIKCGFTVLHNLLSGWRQNILAPRREGKKKKKKKTAWREVRCEKNRVREKSHFHSLTLLSPRIFRWAITKQTLIKAWFCPWQGFYSL